MSARIAVIAVVAGTELLTGVGKQKVLSEEAVTLSGQRVLLYEDET